MKKIIFTASTILGIGLLVFNFTLNNNAAASNKVELSNIQALQASASEFYCDGSSSSTCTITVTRGGVQYTAVGSGQPHYDW